MANPLIAPALIAGGSLLGGLLGRSSSSGQRLSLKKLRHKAITAGFNPLTVLQNGGGQAWAAGYQAGPPKLSSLAVVANALQSGLNTYLSQDPVARETAEVDLELAREQLRRLREQADAASPISPVYSPLPAPRGKPHPLRAAPVTVSSASPVRAGRQPLGRDGVAVPPVPGPGLSQGEVYPGVNYPTGHPPGALVAGNNAISGESAEAFLGDGGGFMIAPWNSWDSAVTHYPKLAREAAEIYLDRRSSERAFETMALMRRWRREGTPSQKQQAEAYFRQLKRKHSK